ncbi:FkbM family methyltransferase [Azospirillum sp. YIM B02556]|uniref:FkbM family methyltransferase n=1 Tax=Azospirillum endophyticum TaxID=2800326 RepID=A0ABS1F0D8_9PROT|nr:FkbM family methyltransferase [Azospirillum endophyticum]MBK1836866.1 FkbM family methyltransferase [Azospirillum endophyticum]
MADDLLAGEGPVGLVKARHGLMMFRRTDTVVGRSLAYYGEYFEQEVALFRQCVRAGDRVIDVGANIGAHTVALARLVGPAGRVLALEPIDANHRLLCGNLALNGLDWADGLLAAAGAADGMLQLAAVAMDEDGNYGALSLEALAGDRPVPVHRLDRLAGEGGAGRIRLIKIDVEGMEAEVLEGARGLIARDRPVLYVENDRPDRSAALIRLLGALGYACYWYLPAFHNPANFAGRSEPIFGHGLVDDGTEIRGLGMGINLFCLPAEAGARINGLLAVAGPDEHPLVRGRNGRFIGG